MTTIIRRYRRSRPAPSLIALAAIMLAFVLIAGLVLVIWHKGGPQPVHEIVIALPAPQVAPAAGRRT